ncbi:hypothetical protein [Halalkalicoccus tibetensis]|uniref:Uncharacterized protein n=1 Tax=Halalkalicoccus tibetensis TaxID=175632 RepID=A0ABD5V6D5_9EURY
MVDENRFAGLADAEAGESDDETNSETEATPQDRLAEPEQATGADTPEEDDSDPSAGPAFSFDETTAKSIYVREDTLDLLEDTELEVELRLRQESDIRDVTGREVMDAVLRVAAANPDAIADQIVAERDGYTDE